jgi:hypothetical protein
MKVFHRTSEILERSTYYPSPEGFFTAFRDFWGSVRGQIAKLETRQEYDESGIESLARALAGDWDAAKALIREFRETDVSLYADLSERKVDFVRCRSIIFPSTTYVKWEMEVYKFNAAHGERIFCCNRYGLEDFFNTVATHDFLIFDARVAAIHDYDEKGRSRGGWVTHDADDVARLLAQFAYIKANSQSHELFEHKG